MKNTTPYFSIIIPTKNEEKLIENCIISVLNQKTTKPYEVILVDTQSKDNTINIVSKYPVKIITETQKGKSVAVKTGSQHAKGNILCFTEADCIVTPHWLNAIEESLSSSPNTVGVTGLYSFFPNTSPYNTLATIILSAGSFFFYVLYKNHAFRGTNFAIKKSIYNKIGGFNQNMHEMHDVELGLRAGKLGKIHLNPRMKIKTSDRRVNNRLIKYFKELIPSIYHLLVLGKSVPKQLYQDIR